MTDIEINDLLSEYFQDRVDYRNSDISMKLIELFNLNIRFGTDIGYCGNSIKRQLEFEIRNSTDLHKSIAWIACLVIKKRKAQI